MDQELWTFTSVSRRHEHRGIQQSLPRTFLMCDSKYKEVEDQQEHTIHQQQNRRQEAAKLCGPPKALAKGRGYAGNLPWCNRCKAHHQPGPCPPRCGVIARDKEPKLRKQVEKVLNTWNGACLSRRGNQSNLNNMEHDYQLLTDFIP
ncbi:hypothetical protein Tco_0564856 [Tanacetum coccineum]